MCYNTEIKLLTLFEYEYTMQEKNLSLKLLPDKIHKRGQRKTRLIR